MSTPTPVWLIVDGDETTLYVVAKLPAPVVNDGPAAFLKTYSLWSLLFPDLSTTPDHAIDNDETIQQLGKEYVGIYNKNGGKDNEESRAISAKMDARLEELRILKAARATQLNAASINIDLMANPDIPTEYHVVKVFICRD